MVDSTIEVFKFKLLKTIINQHQNKISMKLSEHVNAISITKLELNAYINASLD